MNRDKKIWFIGYSRTFWLPASVEGWVVMTIFAVLLFGIFRANGVSGDIGFSLSAHWPLIVEMLAAIAAFYWISSGHVDKRY